MGLIRSVLRSTAVARADHGNGFVDHNLFDQLGSLDPFINLDDFRMSQPYFGPHPHAGFSVMTYMFEDSPGAFVNRDSLGDHSRIEPGGLHWTQAGRGVQHEEVPEAPGVEGHGLQMWVDHAAADRLVPPCSYHLDASEVPEAHPSPGARVRVLVGAFAGVDAAFVPVPRITLLDVHLGAGGAVEVPAAPDRTALVLVVAGSDETGPAERPGSLRAHDAAVFAQDGDRLALRGGPDGVHAIVGHGVPLGGPTLFGGPFVMSSREQLEDAARRHRAGEMGRLDPSF
jgi:redox-sensitive bicupin YhaK (pirin superfamily)